MLGRQNANPQTGTLTEGLNYKKFCKSANLRICDLWSLFADRPPLLLTQHLKHICMLRIRGFKRHLDVLCGWRVCEHHPSDIFHKASWLAHRNYHTWSVLRPVSSSYSHPHQRVLIISREKDDYFPQIFYGYPNSFVGYFYFHCPVGIYIVSPRADLRNINS